MSKDWGRQFKVGDLVIGDLPFFGDKPMRVTYVSTRVGDVWGDGLIRNIEHQIVITDAAPNDEYYSWAFKLYERKKTGFAKWIIQHGL